MVSIWMRTISTSVRVTSIFSIFVVAISALGSGVPRQAQSSAEPGLNSYCARSFAARNTEATVDCSYPAVSQNRTYVARAQIVLDRAVLTFGLRDESRMHVRLTFSNIGHAMIAELRTVYIEFDDASGKNYIRRPLPHVDLRAIPPDGTATFDDMFLVAALRSGNYTVALWIPSPDERFRFQPSRNLLLENARESKRGLNEIAIIAITPPETRTGK